MIIKLQQRLQQLDQLLRTKSTGSPRQLAQKLGITERAWYKLKEQLVEDLQFPITYDRERQTYRYSEPGRVRFEFVKENNEEETKKPDHY